MDGRVGKRAKEMTALRAQGGIHVLVTQKHRNNVSLKRVYSIHYSRWRKKHKNNLLELAGYGHMFPQKREAPLQK